MIDYNIIATGSKGNAVVIDQKILIDCGVSFKALSKVYRALKLVLLTHIHSDHFQPTTLRLLAENRPTLRFACCAWLCKPLVDAVVTVQLGPNEILQQRTGSDGQFLLRELPAGQGRTMAMNGFFEHLGLIGGFILVALDDRSRKRA